MIQKYVLVLLLFFTLVETKGQQPKLKKIIITESNNPALNTDYENMGLPETTHTKALNNLREYVLGTLTLKTHNDPEVFIELMNWVCRQWKHNGWNAAPDTITSLDILKNARDKGAQYRCVEYGLVLQDVLTCFGYTARQIGLKNKDVAYGGAGMGHVATEVWSNELDKWIFLDPQFGVCAKHGETYLNIYDIYLLKQAGKFQEIRFVKEGKALDAEEYSTFLNQYLGYIDIHQKNGDINYQLVLKMEGNDDFLAFQAFPKGNCVFTKDPEQVYFGLNQTMGVINFTPAERQRTDSIFAQLNITTMEAYNDNMYLFSAHPDFELMLINNMPWFEQYEVMVNGKRVEAQHKKYTFTLREGLNTLYFVAYNEQGIKGVPTTISIKYE